MTSSTAEHSGQDVQQEEVIIDVPQTLPSLNPAQPENSTLRQRTKQSYMTRRIEEWNRNDEEEEDSNMLPKFPPGSVGALPLSAQIEFRRKMLAIFAMQLGLLTVMMALLTYVTKLDDIMHDAFEEPLYILVTVAALIVSIGMLYLTHTMFPVNWLVVLIFTGVLSVFIGSVQVYLDTNAGLFCCGFTFVAVCIMVALSSLKRMIGGQAVLRSSLFSGMLAYTLTCVLALIIYGICGDKFMTGAALGLSFALEWILMIWFSYDANTMYKLMTPDEYMNGVIYFYTDLMVLIIISLVFSAVIAIGSVVGVNGGFGTCNCDFYACACLRSCTSSTMVTGTSSGDDNASEEAINPAVMVPADVEMDR